MSERNDREDAIFIGNQVIWPLVPGDVIGIDNTKGPDNVGESVYEYIPSQPPWAQPLFSFSFGPYDFLTMNTYQDEAVKTAVYPPEAAVLYTALGLANEAGELCEKLLPIVLPGGPGESKLLQDVHRALLQAEYAGMLCGRAKKTIRGDYGDVSQGDLDYVAGRVATLSDEQGEALKKEAGDALWYLAALVRDLKARLADVAGANLEKLRSRAERGVIKGSGDNR